MQAVMALLVRLGFHMDFRTNEEIIEELAEEIVYLREQVKYLKMEQEELEEFRKVIGFFDFDAIPMALKFWTLGFSEDSEMTEDHISMIRELFMENRKKMDKSECDALMGKMKAHKNGHPQTASWADRAIRKLQRIAHR